MGKSENIRQIAGQLLGAFSAVRYIFFNLKERVKRCRFHLGYTE
jgi:hypothetical protein